MVSLVNDTVQNSSIISVSNIFDRRQDKRVQIALIVCLRKLFNSQMYKKAVETINISANGLLIVSDVNLEQGAEIEVSNFNREVIVKTVVRHSTKDTDGKYRIGLEILSKNTSWFVPELNFNNPLATTHIC